MARQGLSGVARPGESNQHLKLSEIEDLPIRDVDGAEIQENPAAQWNRAVLEEVSC
jgi:hypothetical protein